MSPEIFSILAKACEQAVQKPRNPHDLSVLEKIRVENFFKSSAYRKYKNTHTFNTLEIFMNTDPDFLSSHIAQLSTLTMKELRQLWAETITTEPPTHVHKRALIERIAYKLQENAQGGLSPEDQQKRALYMERLEKGEPLLGKQSAYVLNPGIILTRDYNGKKYSVRILENKKVEYNGRIYNSLSAVARDITGTRWNGPKFFHCEKR